MQNISGNFSDGVRYLYHSGGILKKNTQVLSVINSNRYFPYCINSTTAAQLIIIFSEPTTVKVDWGNGTIENFNTFINSSGNNEFSIRRMQSGQGSIPNGTFSTIGKDYGTAKTRYLSFEYDRNLVTSFSFTNTVLPPQILSFPISDYTNLKTLNLTLLLLSASVNYFTNSSLIELNLQNISNSQIDRLSITSIFNNSNTYNSVLPLEIFSMPLVSLSIGGNYHVNDFVTSRMNMIGDYLGNTLESLSMITLFTQAQGLPSNFNKLTKLKSLEISQQGNSFKWTSLPSVIASLVSLETLVMNYNILAGFTSLGISFSNTKLTTISMVGTYSTVSNHSWVSTIPTTLRSIDFRSFNSQTNLDSFITAIYNKIKTNTVYQGMTIQVQAAPNYGSSAIPTGIYQQPTTIGSPASSKEMIWELVNIYGCTVTYRAS